MQIDASMAFVTALLLVFVRLSAIFLLTPPFAAAKMPLLVRNFLLLALAAALVTGLQIQPALMPTTLSGLVMAATHELVVGAALAFGLHAAFGAFLFGGRILDFQMGFGVANLIDPATNTQAPMLGTVLNLMAVATFFLLDGHHMMIRGIVYSLQQVPVGGGLDSLNIAAFIAQFGRMFTYGLMLVAPAAFALLLLDVGLAVAARTMPQVNIFIVGLPLKIFVGLVVLTLSISYLSPLINRIFESVFLFWEQILT